MSQLKYRTYPFVFAAVGVVAAMGGSFRIK